MYAGDVVTLLPIWLCVTWLMYPMLAEMGIMLIYYASIMLYYAKNYAILC